MTEGIPERWAAQSPEGNYYDVDQSAFDDGWYIWCWDEDYRQWLCCGGPYKHQWHAKQALERRMRRDDRGHPYYN